MEVIGEYGKYIAILAGLISGLPLVWQRREKLAVKSAAGSLAVCIMFSAFSVLSALLFGCLESVISGNGMTFSAISTYGIYSICPLLILLVCRFTGKEAKAVFDVYALYALPSLFFLRINCMAAGCCGGRQIGLTELHWPTRQAEMIFYLIMFVILLKREHKTKAGTAFPLLTGAYGIFRFFCEWLREADTGSLVHLAHGWSCLAAVIGLGIYFELANEDKRKGSTRKGV